MSTCLPSVFATSATRSAFQLVDLLPQHSICGSNPGVLLAGYGNSICSSSQVGQHSLRIQSCLPQSLGVVSQQQLLITCVRLWMLVVYFLSFRLYQVSPSVSASLRVPPTMSER